MRRLLSLAVMAYAAPAAAQVDHDTAVWSRVGVEVPLDAKWSLTADVQPRITDNVTYLSQVETRVFVTRTLSPHWRVAGGYYHVFLPIDGGDDAHENRVFEQVTYVLPPLGRGELSIRARLEQRWRSTGRDRQDRARGMIRFSYPIARGGTVKAVAYEETFWALNAVDWRPRAGLDQERTFVGVQLPAFGGQLDTGYLNQIVDLPGRAYQMNHVAVLSLAYHL